LPIFVVQTIYMSYSTVRKNIGFIKIRKLIVVSAIVGLLSTLLAIMLKSATEYFETMLFAQAESSLLLMILLPATGLSLIFVLRKYLFKNKQNKGITEIFESTQSRKKNLPKHKIPSHFFNGLLTVAFGGSTGIEVSTVVATATIGSVAQQKANFFREYKTELICAGVAAGITALFGSPIAGILFALEVISRKISKAFLLTTVIGVGVSFAFSLLIHEEPLLSVAIPAWHYHAIPYFALLGILAAFNSVYLTKCVVFFKQIFLKLDPHSFKKVIFGGLALTILALFPQLYGDGYHSMAVIFNSPQSFTIPLLITTVAILILKPVATSVTLASGGDGGVFAPSLFVGAFLGLLTATVMNTFMDADVVPINFMVIGMAAVLSASIHAPFTALFLVCGVVDDYSLFFPILFVCLISKFTAKMIYPFTVYNIPSYSK
jgi:CIC family chloride channel protein